MGRSPITTAISATLNRDRIADGSPEGFEGVSELVEDITEAQALAEAEAASMEAPEAPAPEFDVDETVTVSDETAFNTLSEEAQANFVNRENNDVG